MINLNLSLANPWYKENFKNLFGKFGTLNPHTVWEFEVIRYSRTLFEVAFEWTVRTDHAGPHIELGLFGYTVSARIYDTRHWDHNKNCWEIGSD